MGQLHQVLAVEESKKTALVQALEEGVNTFAKKEHLFRGVVIRQESLLETTRPEYQDHPDSTEEVPVQETVHSKLQYIAEVAQEYYDVVASKDEANMSARADLIVDGQVLLSNVPATTLLFIENKLKAVRNLVNSIRTLDGAKIWNNRKDMLNIVASPETSKVVKVPIDEFKTVAPATDKHPAQVAKITVQDPRAVRYTTELSGLISSMEKSKLLAKVDKLINAAKQARQTANGVEAPNVQIGKAIFDFILS